MTLEQIRDRIAKVLEWSREETDSFSLPTLQSLVRGKDKNLDRILKDVIESGQHLFIS